VREFGRTVARVSAPGSRRLRDRPPSLKKARKGATKGRETGYALIAACGLFCVLAVSLLVGANYQRAARAERALARETALSLETGSILFVPSKGNRCRQRLIDNTSWIMRDNGFIDCDFAVATSVDAERQRWSQDRIEAIRSGLRKQ
jgi:hypothetical protein